MSLTAANLGSYTAVWLQTEPFQKLQPDNGPLRTETRVSLGAQVSHAHRRLLARGAVSTEQAIFPICASLKIIFQSNHMPVSLYTWASQEGKDSILMQHAQGMASMKPVSAGVDEVWVTGRGDPSHC